MGKYVEFRDELETNKTGRACVIPVVDLSSKIDPYKDCYRSLFYYDEEILKHVTEKNTVSGFRGKAGIDMLVWDFDNKDLNKAKEDTIALIDRLNNEYHIKDSEIGVFFSGRKGFAVEVRVDGISGLDGILDVNIPIYVKRLCTKIAGDLESFDRVIYNHNRLYRISGTLHQKDSELNGVFIRLFKTSLPINSLREAEIDQLRDYCREARLPERIEAISDTSKISQTLTEIITHIDDISKEIVHLPTYSPEGIADESEAPSRMKTCIWRIMQGTYTDGRDNALLRAADYENKQGSPASVIKSKLQGVLELMNLNDPKKAKLDPITDYDLDRIVTQVYNNEYDFGCNDPVLDSLCSKKCYLAPRKFKQSKIEVVTLSEAYQRSAGFYKNYYDNIVPTGFRTMDESLPLFKGTFNLIVGRAGTGKTSFMLNIMKHASSNGTSALFFSADMSEAMLVARCAPILLSKGLHPCSYSSKDFMKAHAQKNTKLIDQAIGAFDSLGDNVRITSERGLTAETIGEEIDRQENLLGKKTNLVIIDYVQLLRSEKEGFANHEHNAEAITQLAKEKDVCVLGLSQATGERGDANILAKGSRAWEEQVSTQINCFRPFAVTHPEYDYIMSVNMAKNRMGGTDTIDLFFDGASGFMRDLQEGEKLELSGLRDRLDHEK